MNPFILILFSAAANASLNILLKTILKKAPSASFLDTALLLARNPLVWLGGLLFVASFGFYSMALQKVNLTTAYPFLVSTVTLVITSVSLLFLGESLTLAKTAGIIFLLSGVWLIVR